MEEIPAKTFVKNTKPFIASMVLSSIIPTILHRVELDFSALTLETIIGLSAKSNEIKA